jgi:acylglycerol lipase
MDFNIELNNRQVLRGIIKSPGEHLQAVIIMVHGLGEHIQRYSSWADMFNEAGIGFAGVDLPGHGRTEGKRGYIKSYAVLDEMTDILINECRKTFPAIPLFLYGHSLGGGFVLNYLIRKEPRLRGAVVTSPWLRLSFEPAKSKVKMAAVMKNIYPGMVSPSGLVIDHISHDREVVEKYRNDPLIHDKISVSLFHAAMSAAAFTLKNASTLKIPLLIMHGADDQICSPEGSREFVSKTKNAELKIWENGYHELHNEIFYKDVFDYILHWINARIGKQ